MEEKKIAEFDGDYGRTGTIVLREGKCDVCQRATTVIAVDASEGEYKAGNICQRCAEAAFQGASMRTADLTGAQLDYWVAKALGMKEPNTFCDGEPRHMTYDAPFSCGPAEDDKFGDCFEPSERWSHGGPIIDQMRINVLFVGGEDGFWQAGYDLSVDLGRQCESGWLDLPAVQLKCEQSGPTPLIAAMRAFVASKFGAEVPDL